MRSPVFVLATWSACIAAIHGQTLLSALEARPELVLFNDFINSIPSLLDNLTNLTSYTVLAPSDTAMTRWLNDSSPAPSQDQIVATLNYHILQGRYPLASFETTPQFAPSHLTNSSFTNVTGGAVVELSSDDGQNPVAVSALRMNSAIIVGDLSTNGGSFHIIDTVLAVPQSKAATAVEANLQYYNEITATEGYTTGANKNANSGLGVEADMTFFIPSTATALNDFNSITTGWSADQLSALVSYHAIPGSVAYSSSLLNGTVLHTLQGTDVTIYAGPNNTMYANNVKILSTDYLITNGVMHTIDGVLNPYNTTGADFPKSKKQGLSIGAIAGIAVGGVALLLVGACAFVMCRRRSKQKSVGKPLEIAKPFEGPDFKSSANSSTRELTVEPFVDQRTSKRGPSAPADDHHRRERIVPNYRKDQYHPNQSSTSKPSQRESSQRSYQTIEMTKYVKVKENEKWKEQEKERESEKKKEKEKAKVRIQSIVAEQLDAFRRSGYIDASPGSRITTAAPVILTIKLDAESPAERNDLSGEGYFPLQIIDEGHEVFEMAGDVPHIPPVEIDGTAVAQLSLSTWPRWVNAPPIATPPVRTIAPAVTPLSIASSRANLAEVSPMASPKLGASKSRGDCEGHCDIDPLSQRQAMVGEGSLFSRVSNRTIATVSRVSSYSTITEETPRNVSTSRASRRAMVLDRR